MRLLLILIASLTAVPGAAGQEADPGWLLNYRPARSEALPPTAPFTGPQGNEITLADFRGKLVVLNFWATWCAPCLREMPSLDRLQGRLGGQDLEVVALSSDRAGAERVDPFFAKAGIVHLARYLDPRNKVARSLGVRRLPTTLLIDRRGRLMGRLEGAAEWDSPEIVTFLKTKLEADRGGSGKPD